MGSLAFRVSGGEEFEGGLFGLGSGVGCTFTIHTEFDGKC